MLFVLMDCNFQKSILELHLMYFSPPFEYTPKLTAVIYYTHTDPYLRNFCTSIIWHFLQLYLTSQQNSPLTRNAFKIFDSHNNNQMIFSFWSRFFLNDKLIISKFIPSAVNDSGHKEKKNRIYFIPFCEIP